MKAIFALLVETVALVTVIGLIQLAILIFRNPHRPNWLKADAVQSLTTTGFVAALAFAVAFEIAGLVEIGVNAFLAIGLSAAIVLGIGCASWRYFDMGERLRCAEAGESPFYRIRRSEFRGRRKPEARPCDPQRGDAPTTLRSATKDARGAIARSGVT